MTKTTASFLKGEELSARVALKQWLQSKLASGEDIDLLEYLLKNGKMFDDRWLAYPPTLVRPSKTEPFKCHSNSILYAALVEDQHKDRLDLFKFVTGIYGMHATADTVPPEKKYFISPHSFLIYKDLVLDCTFFQHPPLCFSADQYFGIEVPIPVLLNLVEQLPDDTVLPLNPLEFLKKKPYSP